MKQIVKRHGDLYFCLQNASLKGQTHTGMGASRSRQQALLKARHELQERLHVSEALTILKSNLLKQISVDQATVKRWERLKIFRPEQKKLVTNHKNFSRKSPTLWIKAWDWSKSSPSLVPIFWFGAQPNLNLLETTTSGWATTNSFELSRTLGLLEILERDAFLFHWYTKKRPQLINREKDRKNNRAVFQMRFPTPWRVHVVGTLISQDRPPYMVMGLGSAFDLQEAIEKSYLEAHSLYYFAFIDLEFQQLPVDGFYDHLLKSPSDRLKLYGFHNKRNVWKFLTEGPSTEGYKNSFKDSSLSQVVENLNKRKVQIYSIDLPKRLEFATSAVCSPQLIHVEFDYSKRNLGSPRLRHVPWSRLNHDPHPFG